jgi:hypothetical protein
MSWGAQNRSKDAKTPSGSRGRSDKPEPGLWPVQQYGPFSRRSQEEKSRCFTRAFFSFQEDCVPSMNTEPLGHVAISWHK